MEARTRSGPTKEGEEEGLDRQEEGWISQ